MYDNNSEYKKLTPDWGFACVVRGLEKTILFDTGSDDRILLPNMRKLGIEPGQIDVVVISHSHGNHTGGLGKFLAVRADVPVYAPTGLREPVKEQIRSHGGKLVEADGSLEICPGART
ncbi:MAG: MBL fold metallo-hydrolase, partial [Desulfurococcales archaeon]|nr:MBL fold metallo-hydrolase [Desulfurococcales archaeon]